MRQHSLRVYLKPVYDGSHCAAVFVLPDAGFDKMRDRICACQKRCVAVQYCGGGIVYLTGSDTGKSSQTLYFPTAFYTNTVRRRVLCCIQWGLSARRTNRKCSFCLSVSFISDSCLCLGI